MCELINIYESYYIRNYIEEIKSSGVEHIR